MIRIKKSPEYIKCRKINITRIEKQNRLIDKDGVDVSCYPKCTKERRSKCGCVEAYQYYNPDIKTFRDCPYYSLGRCTNEGWGGL